jgi:dipeptidyl aminopeptidase/acylaminoacyl peptidase
VRYSLNYLSILLLFAISLSAGNESIKFQDFFSVNRLGIPHVSPDRKQIVFTVTTANIEDNKFQSQIWLMNADGSNLRQLTSHSSTNSNPFFSYDGKSLYFLSNRQGPVQIWRISLAENETAQAISIYGDLQGFTISPDNRFFLLVRNVPEDCADENCIQTSAEAAKNRRVEARIIDHLMYRHWNQWLDDLYSHLFLASLDGKILKDLIPGPIHIPPIALGSDHDYCFSPDGKEIVYVANPEINTAISTNNDIFLMNTSNFSSQKISTSLGNDNNPHYSPDGRYIAYTSMKRAGFEADRQRLMIYDRSTTEISELTKDFSYSVEEILWSADGKEIYFTAQEKGNISIYRISLNPRALSAVLKGHYIEGIAFLGKGQLVFAKQSTRLPSEIYTLDLRSGQLNALTHFNDEILARFDLPDYEEFWFIGAQGDSIQGFIMKPPHFVEGKKYPAVHLIHGGPQGMWSNDWHYRWNYQMFAAPGYAVYFINFHGSRGYGQKFTDSISRHWGDLPYEDLVKGTEYIIKNFDFIDPERLAAAGASYGGFMINWIAGHENPYKCLISHDGTYEQVSMWGATEELWFPEWELAGVPWQEGSLYNKWSPSRLAGNFKTPTLVIHGEHDYRVPYTQGLQLFTALQRLGVPSRLLFFPDEDHWVRKPLNAQLWWDTVYDWLEKYLENEQL